MLKIDENNALKDIVFDSDANELIMCGVLYWSTKDSKILKELIEKVIVVGDSTELFWDNPVKDNIDVLNVLVRECTEGGLFEINSKKVLETLNSS